MLRTVDRRREHATSPTSGRRTMVVVLSASLLAGACSDPLSVRTPDIVRPGDLNTASGLAAFRAGAYGDFVRSLSGHGITAGLDGHLQLVCLLTDECHSTTTNAARNETDARRTTDTNADVVEYYRNLHRARFAAENAAERYRSAEQVNEREEGIAELEALAGYTYVHFAEAFCSGVPFSGLDGNTIVFGQPETTEQMFQRAIDRFDAALAAATSGGIPTLEYVARVGKARALLGLGRYQEAAQVVAAVPTDFLYTIKYSTNTPEQENGLFGIINVQQRISVTTSEGINGIDFFGAYDAGDPRTPYEAAGRGFDETPHFRQFKYSTPSSAVPLASGIEARLTEAEARLAEGDVAGFQAIHEAIRATIGLEPVSVADMTPDERIDFHFAERARWLWLEGKRLGDLRRLVRQYGRPAESVFPTGPYFRPHYATFGERVNLPIPRIERDNPNFTSCLSEAA